jgi:hypothetical protein
MAQINLCTVDKLDPEDPRCARASFNGNFQEVTDAAELQFAKDALFERHPAMADWPEDHSWKVHKIVLNEIWLIDIYGGGKGMNTPPSQTLSNFSHSLHRRCERLLRSAIIKSFD